MRQQIFEGWSLHSLLTLANQLGLSEHTVYIVLWRPKANVFLRDLAANENSGFFN